MLSPLTNDLFAEHHQFHGELIGLTPKQMDTVRLAVSKEHAGAVEQWFTSEWDSIVRLREDVSKQSKRALFGRFAFYIWSLFLEVSKTYGDKNGYGIFIDRLCEVDEPFGLISFNYDLLLDRAIQDRAGRRLNTIQDYRDFNYLKPHGSVNWYLKRRTGDPTLEPGVATDATVALRTAASNMFRGDPLVMTHNTFVLPPDFETFRGEWQGFPDVRRALDTQYFYPLVFMPLTTKMYGFVADFQSVLEESKEMIARANQVFLVGYQAGDQIIRELLANPPVRPDALLHVVGVRESSAREIQKRVLGFATAMRPGQIYGGGFMKFVNEELEQALRIGP